MYDMGSLDVEAMKIHTQKKEFYWKPSIFQSFHCFEQMNLSGRAEETDLE